MLNNMAWALRRFPVFPVFGNGDYPVQPIHAEDLAALAVAAGSAGGNIATDPAGPETLSFEALLRLLASATGVRCRFVHTSASLGLALTRLVGLMAGLLTSDCAPTGITTLSSWLHDNGDVLGRRYVSELRRNYRR